MRAVIYIQKLNGEKDSRPPIAEQRKIMREAAKKTKWKVTQEYIDNPRKGDYLEFEHLKNDSLGRKFDCVVLYSLDSFGRNRLVAIDVLQNVFMPAGIEFRVIEPDYCSAGLPDEDVRSFLERIRTKSMTDARMEGLKRHFIARDYNQYGYLFISDGCEKHMVIDDVACAVVKDIFAMFQSGMLPSAIVRELNDRNIESPTQHFYSLGLYSRSRIRQKWDTGPVMNILKNEIYTGKYTKHFMGTDLMMDCPIIIDQDTYDKVQVMLEQRPHAIKKSKSTESPFARILYDNQSGSNMVCYDRSRIENYCYRAVLQRGPNTVLSEGKLLHKDAIELTKKLLRKEKEQAQEIYSFLCSHEGKIASEMILEKHKQQQKNVIDRIIELNDRFLSLEMLSDKRESIKNEITRLEDLLSQLEKSEPKIAQAVGVSNPWIKLYLTYDARNTITRDITKKYVKRLDCIDFQTLILTPFENEWKEMIPKEWWV